MPDKIILLDMDGVIVDYERGFLNAWREKHPELPFIPFEQRTTFYPREQYPKELAEEITNSKGFYRNLPPMPGFLEAIFELQHRNLVLICTSQKTSNPYCISEKIDWIVSYLGKEYKRRTIITKDKTLIKGHFLIDDNPEIKGVITPAWKHILYKQPYNQGKFTWQNWKDFL